MPPLASRDRPHLQLARQPKRPKALVDACSCSLAIWSGRYDPHRTFLPAQPATLSFNGYRLMRRVGELYHFWLHEAPLLTKVVTAATLFGAGDRIAQRIEAKAPPGSVLSADHPVDEHVSSSNVVSPSTARTLRMMVWGGLFAAPIMHTWFHVVDRVIPGTGRLVIAKKVVADMMVIAPGTSLAFFTLTKCMEGEPVGESFEVAKAKLPPTLLADYMLWPAANAIIFGLVPLHYRTPLTHCVSLVWSAFLSGMASHEPPKLTTPWETVEPKPSVPSSAIALQ